MCFIIRFCCQMINSKRFLAQNIICLLKNGTVSTVWQGNFFKTLVFKVFKVIRCNFSVTVSRNFCYSWSNVLNNFSHTPLVWTPCVIQTFFLAPIVYGRIRFLVSRNVSSPKDHFNRFGKVLFLLVKLQALVSWFPNSNAKNYKLRPSRACKLPIKKS